MEKNRILLAAVLIFTVIWNKIPFEIAVVSASESYTVLCEIPQNETTEAATETSESETGDEIKETSQTTELEIENETKEMNSTQTETEEEIETQKTKTVDRAAEQDNLDLSTVASAGDLDTDGYHWEGASGSYKFTLKNITIRGVVTLPDDTVTIVTEGSCSIHELKIYKDPDKTKLSFSGAGELSIDEHITISGGNDNAIVVETGARVCANKGISIGASGGVDSTVTVDGTLTVKGGENNAISAGQVIVGSGGTLNVSGAKGVALNGRSTGNFEDVFIVRKNGCLSADCMEFNLRVFAGSGTFDEAANADRAINVPDSYMPEDCEVKQGAGVIDLVRKSTGEVYTGPLTIHEKHEWSDRKDSTSHWKVCTVAGCGRKSDVEKHSFDNNTRLCQCGAKLNVVLKGTQGLIYNGQAQTPDITVTVDSQPLDAKNYNIEYSNHINAGEASVTVMGTEVIFNQTERFQIGRATPVIAWGDAVQELDYTGSTAVITAPAVTLVNDEAYSGTIQYSYTAQGSNEWMGGLPSGIGVYTVKAMIAEQDNYTAAESEEMTLAIQCSHIHTELRNQKKATCTQEGYSGDTYCKECGTLVKSGAKTEMEAHIGGKKTCISGKICAVCKKEYTEKDENVHEHTEVRGQKKATCTEEGYSGDTYCKDCGTLVKSGAKTEMEAHIGGKKTCISGKICAVCKKEYTDKDENVHEHTEIRGQKKATCTVKGNTGDTYCKDCNKKISSGKAILALGHDWHLTSENEKRIYTCSRCAATREETIQKQEHSKETHSHSYKKSVLENATCTKSGKMTYICGCGASYTEIILALGHEYTQMVTMEPTIFAEGAMTYTCSRCGHCYTKSISKLDQHEHVYTAKVLKEATCTEEGIRMYACVCGDTYTERIPMLVHSYDAKLTQEPTAFAEGVMTYICSRCDDTFTKSIDKIEDTVSMTDSQQETENPSITENMSSVTDMEIESSACVVREETDPAQEHRTDAAKTLSQTEKQFPWWIILILVLIIIIVLYMTAKKKNKTE